MSSSSTSCSPSRPGSKTVAEGWQGPGTLKEDVRRATSTIGLCAGALTGEHSQGTVPPSRAVGAAYQDRRRRAAPRSAAAPGASRSRVPHGAAAVTDVGAGRADGGRPSAAAMRAQTRQRVAPSSSRTGAPRVPYRVARKLGKRLCSRLHRGVATAKCGGAGQHSHCQPAVPAWPGPAHRRSRRPELRPAKPRDCPPAREHTINRSTHTRAHTLPHGRGRGGLPAKTPGGAGWGAGWPAGAVRSPWY